jgi:aspartate carbamoyltransferase catalytic subunit
MSNNIDNKHLISIDDLSRSQIDAILELSEQLKHYPDNDYLKNKVIAACFFEASTRTRLSFESAILRLGGNVIGFSDSGSTSLAKKGETLEDTIKVISQYSDGVIIRHPESGSALRASKVSTVSVINAGDGANEHPTQTLLDLFTIKETQGRLDNLKIAMVGDLRYGRTVHSLSIALSLYSNVELVFIAPDDLQMPKHICEYLQDKNIKFSISSDLENSIKDVDIIYMTRIQLERLSGNEKYVQCVLNKDLVKRTKTTSAILHPLPRREEIDVSVDILPQAKYFQQAQNGLYVRQAILKSLIAK